MAMSADSLLDFSSRRGSDSSLSKEISNASKVTLRSDFDALQLRQFAKRSSDTRQTCRLLALAAVYDGMSRGEAAKVGGMDRQTLRDWVHRFNDLGPDGLVNPGSPSPTWARTSSP